VSTALADLFFPGTQELLPIDKDQRLAFCPILSLSGKRSRDFPWVIRGIRKFA
jgi:hypothetical protein